jgi:hypothetical protein
VHAIVEYEAVEGAEKAVSYSSHIQRVIHLRVTFFLICFELLILIGDNLE